MAYHCKICNIVLNDDYAFQGHLAGKKHLKNAEQNDRTSKSVYIYWGHNQFDFDDFLAFLSSFSQIDSYKFGPYKDYGIFQFADSQAVKNLLSSSLIYEGTKLFIKPKAVHKNTPSKQKTEKDQSVEEADDEISFKNLKPIFEKNNFNTQLDTFLKAVSLTDAEIQSMYEPICFHLNRLFQQSYPRCRASRFGSTVTGLCFKKCDLDIFMNIGLPISYDEDDTSPRTVTFRKVFADAKRILYRKNQCFSNVVPIPRAKTPIIKFFNVQTKTYCDLSFRNSLGVHNSLLIKHYLLFDPRLKPLMMLIKYWSKLCDFSIDSRGGRLTNYALVMLFIFYLQQPDVNLVPPVAKLKNSFNPRIIDGWQVDFNTKFQHHSNNKSSIPQLLFGFFNFYANFNFNENVICPLDGKVYNKLFFKDIDQLPKSMDRYKEYMGSTENPIPLSVQKPICIQDPNELNHNCASNVTSFLLEIFQKHLSTSADVCEKAVSGDCSRLLLNLFQTMPEIAKNISKKSSKNIQFSIFIQNFLQPESSDDNVTVDSGKFTLENLFNIVLELVKNIFMKVYKMKVDVFTIAREQKQQKTSVDSDVHTKNNEKILLHCTGNQCLWKDRKIKFLTLDPSYSAIEKEVIISQQMLKKNEQDSNQVNIALNCLFEKLQSPPKVILTLSNENSEKFYTEFASILKTKIPSIVEKTLFHMVQYKKSSITFDRYEESPKD